MTDGLRRWWPLWIWGGVVILVAGWVRATVARDLAEGMEQARLRVQSMADLAAEHIEHLYDSADAAVKVATPLFTRDHDWNRLAADYDGWQLLRDLGRAQHTIPSLFMADQSGRFRMHAGVFPAPDKTIENRQYFQALRATPTDQAYVTEPVVGMILERQTLILARRLDYADGRFAGVIAANVDPRTVVELFETLGVGDRGVVNVQRGDGTILVRHPFREGAVGSKVDNRTVFPAMAEGKVFASNVTVSPLDGVERITSFRRLKHYDLVVLAAIPLDRIMAPWRQQSVRMVSIVAFGIIGLTTLFVLLLRRYHAESETLARLKVSEANLLQAQQVARLGYYIFDFTNDHWESSAILDDIFGIDQSFQRTAMGWLSLVEPGARWRMAEYLNGILNGEHDFDQEYPILRRSDGACRWVAGLGKIECDDSGKPCRLVGTIKDITQRKTAELDLKAKAEELIRSNTELEQFAYVASHDLREPLRMVSSYVDLLQRRYGSQLGEEALEFIGFARDGAKRMDRLVLDLLEYSRIGRITKPMSAIPLGKVFDRAVRALSVKIDEARAEIILPPDPLPSVWGDGDELSRLFQNLIGNAVKYRDPERPPVIRLSVAPADGGWEIKVADNGIGIDPQFFDRIFLIFQRLHRRGEYEGTGIGLAICKKVVEHHGGRIAIESVPGEGSAFSVVLPAVNAHAPQQ
ncbi:ATP-binding protein [Paramagnetospirillum kuznetsovii]|nr:ATP-binding protein [Paramagnetospirillum kuznetsovii]